MPATPTILFVHGTGVRLPSYRDGFRDAAAKALEYEIPNKFEQCPWADIFGAKFSPRSLPEPPSVKQLEEEQQDYAEWVYLFDDPMFELRTLAIPRKAGDPFDGLGAEPKYKKVWNTVRSYKPSLELQGILEREQLGDLWEDAHQTITGDADTEKAFRVTGDETAESTNAVARAIVAELTRRAEAAGKSGPGREARSTIASRLLEDWKHQVFGLSEFFSNLVGKPATYLLKKHRSDWSQAIANPLGDILLYQANGAKIRNYIRAKIQQAGGPVVLMAHSLGGIACVDLLNEDSTTGVKKLITLGSQAPFLYELGALHSLKPPTELPPHFPAWLNLYDRNDFLSYLAGPVFPQAANVTDVEIESRRPFPASHSAYLGSKKAWQHIGKFLK
jgi:hypothetical protein